MKAWYATCDDVFLCVALSVPESALPLLPVGFDEAFLMPLDLGELLSAVDTMYVSTPPSVEEVPFPAKALDGKRR